LLDEACIWTDNPDPVARVRHALRLLDEYGNQLANLRLGHLSLEDIRTPSHAGSAL